MPSLRDHLRKALSAREPSEVEAKRDLDAVLARARAAPRPVARPFALGLALAVAAAFAIYLARRNSPPPVSIGPAPPIAVQRGVHLYVNVTGEPESRALAFDLDPHGEP